MAVARPMPCPAAVTIIFLDEIKKDTEKWLNEKEINTVFLKPKYGDASGVRGAAWLGRKLLY